MGTIHPQWCLYGVNYTAAHDCEQQQEMRFRHDFSKHKVGGLLDAILWITGFYDDVFLGDRAGWYLYRESLDGGYYLLHVTPVAFCPFCGIKLEVPSNGI